MLKTSQGVASRADAFVRSGIQADLGGVILDRLQRIDCAERRDEHWCVHLVTSSHVECMHTYVTLVHVHGYTHTRTRTRKCGVADDPWPA